MHRLLIVVAMGATVLSCGGKKKEPKSSGESSDTVEVPTGFVTISLDEEEDDLDELFAVELLQATAQCGDLIKLEPAAILGSLSDGEVRCLEESLREAEKQTIKDKLSRVVMADSWAKGDKHRWESIVRRHLEEIDRSDPDLCYKFARYTSKKGPEYFDETMKWVDVALENRTMWTGDLHVKRVYSLYKLKATTAQSKWTHLESEYLEGPTGELNEARKEARNQAKTYSREWLEYARSAGKDPTMALQLCVSAAGTSDFCEQ